MLEMPKIQFKLRFQGVHLVGQPILACNGFELEKRGKIKAQIIFVVRT